MHLLRLQVERNLYCQLRQSDIISQEGWCPKTAALSLILEFSPTYFATTTAHALSNTRFLVKEAIKNLNHVLQVLLAWLLSYHQTKLQRDPNTKHPLRSQVFRPPLPPQPTQATTSPASSPFRVASSTQANGEAKNKITVSLPMLAKMIGHSLLYHIYDSTIDSGLQLAVKLRKDSARTCRSNPLAASELW